MGRRAVLPRTLGNLPLFMRTTDCKTTHADLDIIFACVLDSYDVVVVQVPSLVMTDLQKAAVSAFYMLPSPLTLLLLRT